MDWLWSGSNMWESYWSHSAAQFSQDRRLKMYQSNHTQFITEDMPNPATPDTFKENIWWATDSRTIFATSPVIFLACPAKKTDLCPKHIKPSFGVPTWVFYLLRRWISDRNPEIGLRCFEIAFVTKLTRAPLSIRFLLPFPEGGASIMTTTTAKWLKQASLLQSAERPKRSSSVASASVMSEWQKGKCVDVPCATGQGQEGWMDSSGFG